MKKYEIIDEGSKTKHEKLFKFKFLLDFLHPLALFGL